MDYIDIHCHLPARTAEESVQSGGDFLKKEDCLDAVIKRMKENKVGAITIGTDLESSRRAVKIAEEAGEKYGWPYIWACIGVHPNESDELWDMNYELWEKLAQSSKVVGIGECGLDFFRTKPKDLEQEKERQTKLFKKQIEFALKHNKPLMLHCRSAYEEVLEILKEYKDKLKQGEIEGGGDGFRGNSHFFAGNVDQAKKFVELGFSCSFTGVITFTHDYDEVIRSLPQNMIMSETDAPFVAPVPYRGKRNEPFYVIEIVKKMAEIKGSSERELAMTLVDNAKRMFDLKLV